MATQPGLLLQRRPMRGLSQVLLASALACTLSAHAGDSANPTRSDLHMSASLQGLFRQEMTALLSGTQRIAAALPVGDWKGISETSATIQHSYVLEKRLTEGQQDELSRLPQEFKALDEAFHERAGKLERAANAHDPESAAFHFSRLLEACTTCHTRFAKTRFPAFVTPQASDKGH